MTCLHCGKLWNLELLKGWQDGVAFWFTEHANSVNPNLYCPNCAPIPLKERCIGCALHWPQDLVSKRLCPLCQKRRKPRDYPAMTRARFSKLYRET